MLLSVIWGNAFVAIRRADFELSPVNLTLLRWVIVAACFAALYPFLVGRGQKPQPADVPRLLVVSLFSVAVYHLSLNYAEKTVSASLAGLLISLAPMFGVILSAALLKESVGGRLWVAMVLALAGAALLSASDFKFGFQSLSGPLAVVLAAFASGAYTVASKPLVTKYGPFPVAVWTALAGTAMLLPLASQGLVAQAESLSLWGWASVLYLALLSTVAANLILYTLVGRQEVSRLSIQLYLVPVVSVAGGVLILGETLGALVVIGGGVLLFAVGLATRR